MKKRWIKMLCLLLTLALLAGCAATAKLPEENDAVQENQFDFGTLPTVGINWDAMEEDPTQELPYDADVDWVVPQCLDYYQVDTISSVVKSDTEPVRYVLIYNPDLYDEQSYGNFTRSTGNFGMQVEVDLNKGGLETPQSLLSVDQGQINEGIDLTGMEAEQDRAGLIIEPFQVGQTKTFYCYDEVSLNNPRISRTFTCRYAGTNCNIWVADIQISDALVNDYGSQFDNYTYNSVVQSFGQPRFAQNGGKVNFLYYPMPDGTGGCFCGLDLYAYNEVTPQMIAANGINTDLDIVHINGIYTAYEQMQLFMRSTMAHEFQHLICATNTFESTHKRWCDTWLNEAMSGYIEEVLFPGTKENEGGGHMDAFRGSERIRSGQSMYNFGHTQEDFGVYGSVYLFAQYMAHLAGPDVFSNFHRYWRFGLDTQMNVPEAVSESFDILTNTAVDQALPYPQWMLFDSEYEAWMSKLTLQFYLELLTKDEDDPACFATVDGRDLLYNQINPASIEGGGRIIIALSGDSYVIPEDADRLVYVGLNENFEPVTDIIYY